MEAIVGAPAFHERKVVDNVRFTNRVLFARVVRKHNVVRKILREVALGELKWGHYALSVEILLFVAVLPGEGRGRCAEVDGKNPPHVFKSGGANGIAVLGNSVANSTHSLAQYC